MVRPGFKGRHRCDLSFGSAIFQILTQERAQDLLPEVERGIAVELQRS